MPKISVIIPVYNAEKYIGKCLENILLQTMVDFEVILINDGSQDSSAHICNDIAKRDNRVIVLNQENMGPSIARNKGIEKATGEYIVFIDSDDYVEKDFLEVLLGEMDEECDWVLCGYEREYNNQENLIHKLCHQCKVISLHSEYEKRKFLFKNLFKYVINWELWGKCFRSSIIKENDIRLPENINFAEDLYFCTLYALYANKIKCIPYIGYHYVESEGSIMGKSYDMVRANEMISLVSRLENEIQKRKLKYFRKEICCVFYFYLRIQLVEFLYNHLEDMQKFEEVIENLAEKQYVEKNVKEFLKHKVKNSFEIGIKEYLKGYPVFVYILKGDKKRLIKSVAYIENIRKWKIHASKVVIRHERKQS